ncbi:hypothetical protein KIN20_006740 [Parelaphostrongylus tenuis]|uniref:Protein kinase domain-containing protein n=1 Tax=Parelaphostrongylus tenuis TaxID=148309 RepID=A0AAD5QJI4_PARTN|nr:hypothetical protein KIN20_006740 [Parelaphostrongylus tenuis]
MLNEFLEQGAHTELILDTIVKMKLLLEAARQDETLCEMTVFESRADEAHTTVYRSQPLTTYTLTTSQSIQFTTLVFRNTCILLAQNTLWHKYWHNIGTNILHAVRQLHDNGFLHRDLKPANVAVGPVGTPQFRFIHISDFGLARQCNVASDSGPPKLQKPRPRTQSRTVTFLSRTFCYRHFKQRIQGAQYTGVKEENKAVTMISGALSICMSIFKETFHERNPRAQYTGVKEENKAVTMISGAHSICMSIFKETFHERNPRSPTHGSGRSLVSSVLHLVHKWERESESTTWSSDNGYTGEVQRYKLHEIYNTGQVCELYCEQVNRVYDAMKKEYPTLIRRKRAILAGRC